jgi:hypothetical protein
MDPDKLPWDYGKLLEEPGGAEKAVRSLVLRPLSPRTPTSVGGKIAVANNHPGRQADHAGLAATWKGYSFSPRTGRSIFRLAKSTVAAWRYLCPWQPEPSSLVPMVVEQTPRGRAGVRHLLAPARADHLPAAYIEDEIANLVIAPDASSKRGPDKDIALYINSPGVGDGRHGHL